jgi:hypothetical protein
MRRKWRSSKWTDPCVFRGAKVHRQDAIEPHRGVVRLAPISACDERAELAEHPAVVWGRRPRDGGGLYTQVQGPAARAPKREREIAAVKRGVIQRRDVPGAAQSQDGHGELVLHLHLGGGGVGWRRVGSAWP